MRFFHALAAILVAAAALGSAGFAAAEGFASPRVLSDAGSDAPDGVFPRKLRDLIGEVEIPAEPKRIVAIQTGQLDSLLTLGVVPAGAARGLGPRIYDDYLLRAFPEKAEAVRAMTDVGARQEPDLEAVASLRPDLILYNKAAFKEATYRALKAIAPVVVTRGMGVNWKVDFLLVGHAVGRAGAAQAALDRHHADAAAFAARWAGATAPSVSFLTATGDRIRLFGRNSFSGGVAEDLGLARPPAQSFETTSQDLSAEIIDEADADWVFYAAQGKDLSAITGAALWPTLEAVRRGRAVRVEFEPFFFNAGPTAARLVAEEIKKNVSSN